MEKDAQKYDIVSGGYPYSTTVSAVAEAARELASDEWLEKVGQQVTVVHISKVLYAFLHVPLGTHNKQKLLLQCNYFAHFQILLPVPGAYEQYVLCL